MTLHENDVAKVEITFMQNGEETEFEAEGEGLLSAVSAALCEYTDAHYSIEVFTQHSMQGDADSKALRPYIGLEDEDGEMYWGAGTDTGRYYSKYQSTAQCIP